MKSQSLERRLSDALRTDNFERARGLVSGAYVVGALSTREYCAQQDDIDRREGESYARAAIIDAQLPEAA